MHGKEQRMKAYTDVERRSGEDRRRQHPLSTRQLFYKGQRKTVRRAADRRQIVALDRYSPSLFVAIIVVLSLSLLDAMFTLILLSRGATELNPVMEYYLSHGPHAFLFVKYGLTSLSVLLIVLLNNALATRYRIGTGMLLHLFAACFGSVVIWQVYLLSI